MKRLFALFALLVISTQVDARPLLMISTENPTDHVQTHIVRRFVERARACCGSQIDIDHRFGAELFRDRDVPTALSRGAVGMGVVGSWHLDRFVAEIGAFMMPVLYGRTEEETNRLVDSPVIDDLSRRLEKALGVEVLGRWLPLGQADTFLVDHAAEDIGALEGLRIRSPGGKVNEWRLTALGAQPVTIAWTDLFPALAQGRLDGLLTTFATLDSVKPWGQSVRYALEDRQYLSLYVPMVSGYAWRQFDEDTRRGLREAWEAGVDDGRRLLRAAQVEARANAVAAGVRVTTPDASAIAAVRERLSKDEAELATRLRIDTEVLNDIRNTLDRRP